MDDRPLTPPCIPSGTRRFNRFHAIILAAWLALAVPHTVSVCLEIQAFQNDDWSSWWSLSSFRLHTSNLYERLPIAGRCLWLHLIVSGFHIAFSLVSSVSNRAASYVVSTIHLFFAYNDGCPQFDNNLTSHLLV